MLSVCAIIKKNGGIQNVKSSLFYSYGDLPHWYLFLFAQNARHRAAVLLLMCLYTVVPAPAGAAVFLESLFQGQNAVSVPVG